jgi:hypothetical protein
VTIFMAEKLGQKVYICFQKPEGKWKDHAEKHWSDNPEFQLEKYFCQSQQKQ